jgi:iron-sulfur cluster assembly accessory protein
MIQITENASAQIRKMLARRGAAETGLRVAVKAGGCSGFEYVFGWEVTPKDTDLVFEGRDGAKIFVDPRSLRLLDGSVLDYDTSLLTKGFVFNNPHATGTCGCGTSFST